MRVPCIFPSQFYSYQELKTCIFEDFKERTVGRTDVGRKECMIFESTLCTDVGRPSLSLNYFLSSPSPSLSLSLSLSLSHQELPKMRLERAEERSPRIKRMSLFFFLSSFFSFFLSIPLSLCLSLPVSLLFLNMLDVYIEIERFVASAFFT